MTFQGCSSSFLKGFLYLRNWSLSSIRTQNYLKYLGGVSVVGYLSGLHHLVIWSQPEGCNSRRKKLGINDSNSSFSPCCAFPNNCWTQNYLQYLCNLSWGNRDNARGLEERSSHRHFSSKYLQTIKCPQVSQHRQLLTETRVLYWAGCSIVEWGHPPKDHPRLRARELTATKPHQIRSFLRGTAAASSNGCRSGVTACLLQDVGQCRAEENLLLEFPGDNHIKNESGIECHKQPLRGGLKSVPALLPPVPGRCHLCHRPPWQSSQRDTAGAAAPSPWPDALPWAILAQGRAFAGKTNIIHT